MGIEIKAGGESSSKINKPRVKEESPVSLPGKSYANKIGPVFGSYERALEQSGLEKRERNPDIIFEGIESAPDTIGVRIVVGKNAIVVHNLLSIAPTVVATTLVEKAVALGKITLPPQIQTFIQPRGMVGGDLSAMIMGRHIHITPKGEIWTPPQMMIGGVDTWHKVKPADTFNLILPDWLHGGVESVSMNTSVESGVLECITWKKQKIRIRPNGEISQVIDKAEFTLDKKEHIHLVIPDFLIGKISFNGEPNDLSLYGTVGYIGDKTANEYICIKQKGVVEKMGKTGEWKKCSETEIQRLGKYPTQAEIQRITQQRNQDAIRQLVKQLKALQN